MKFSYPLTALLIAVPTVLQAADHLSNRPSLENSDLVYNQPAASPDAGQPIGNGRMGTMVWTSPDAIHLQINRVDVFAVNRDHQGQPGQRGSATDYCGGIASVVVHVGGQPFAPGEKSFRQRLSLENAECAIEGMGLQVRCFVSADADVLVMEVDDRRASPERLKVTVSMLRQPEVRAGENIATCTFSGDQSRIVLTQRFRERDYHNASAVAVGVAGNGAVIDQTSATSRTLVLPAAPKKQVILISSAAAWKPDGDVAEAAVALMNAAGSRSVGELRASHHIWWKEFWSRTFVKLKSADGQAEQAERWRNLHLYHMASSSRGELPPKWNGSLFVTTGDQRRWGSQYWVWTTEMLYFPLLAADAVDLTAPYFNMYVRQLPNCEKAAQQRWGVSGAYFPETTAFDGPTVLPDDVASEFQDVLARTETSYGDVTASQGSVPIRQPVERRHRTLQRAIQLDQSCRFVRKRTGGSGLVALPVYGGSGVAAHARLSAAARHGRVLPAPGEERGGRPLSSDGNACP